MEDAMSFSFTVNLNLGETTSQARYSLTKLIAKEAINKKAMQKIYELQGLLEFLENKQLKTIVEIGTALGGTFYALCQIAPADAKIISIDLPGGRFGGEFKIESSQIKKYAKEGQTVIFLREDSHQESTKKQLISHLGGKKIDVLLIDGDHIYGGVKKDFEMYSPLVSKGGIIIFHDICFHPTVPECQVEKFWNEIKNTFEYKEIIDPQDKDWGGIGILINN